MNVDDLQQVLQHRAVTASQSALDVEALIRKGKAARRHRITGAVAAVALTLAAAITVPIAVTRGSGPSATLTPVASPSVDGSPHPEPNQRVTPFPCAGPFLVACGTFPVPEAFVKPVTKAIVDYAGTLDATPQFVVADPAKVAQHFGLNLATMPARVYLMQLKGHFTCLACQGPPGARPTFTYLVAAIAYSPLGPMDTPFFYSTSSHPTNLTQFGRPL